MTYFLLNAKLLSYTLDTQERSITSPHNGVSRILLYDKQVKVNSIENVKKKIFGWTTGRFWRDFTYKQKNAVL